ncbi:MAG: DUF4276 family protein [Deltaproteobacteria bacterium]|nr:DUF4276 family protein [Deltaproteobacteria bacterium]
MTLHLLVEGPSERAFLEPWLKRLLRSVAVKVHPHQGKGSLPANLTSPPPPKQRGLLDQLPAKLRGFANAGSPPPGVLVLIDADDDDCIDLAACIRRAADAVAPDLPVVVCIAVEETEAFYLGDLAALERAYPNADMEMARAYAPDSVCGTWELFGEVIGDGGGNKVLWAERMGESLTTSAARSRSPSFRALVRGLKHLAKRRTEAPKAQRRYRHSPKPKDPTRRR